MKNIRKWMAGVLRCMPWLNQRYTKWKWRERRVSYGTENPDKTFFVVRRATCKVGLFSYVMTNMGLVRQAVEHGWIPVIDMQGNANTYLDEGEVGKKNAWEYFFRQPCGYSLEDISKSRNVILSCGLISEKSRYPGKEIVSDRRARAEWKRLFDRYLLVREDIIKETDALFEAMFHGEKVLGVLCRGTDYLSNRPKNHPVQPEPQEAIRKAREVMREHHCRRIYLATEDEDIYRQFREAFGDALQVTKAKRSENIGHENINDAMMKGERERCLGGRAYLINILLLARCNCLVAGSVGGTYGALLLSNGYEYEYVFDLGVY